MDIAAETPPAPTEGQTSDPYAAVLDAAMAAPTPSARAKAIDALEALSLERARATPAAAEQPADEFAFPAPANAGAYHFTPLPGFAPMAEAEVTEVRTALFDAGIPAEFVGQGFTNLQELERSGAMASEEAYDAAVHKCREVLQRTHGQSAAAIIRDGITYLQNVGRKYPALEHAATAALADPYMLTNAANLQRHGSTRSR